MYMCRRLLPLFPVGYDEDTREQPGSHTIRMDTSLRYRCAGGASVIWYDTPLTPGRRRLGKRYVGECRVADDRYGEGACGCGV